MARRRELLVAVTDDKFQVLGDQLSGRGLSLDASPLLGAVKVAASERDKCLVEIADVIYRQGRSSVLPSWDDRFELHNAVEALRALAVIAGHTPTGDRRRREADILARLLHQQEEGT